MLPSSPRATQIAVDVEILESDAYFSNAIQDRLGDGSADVFMSGPVLLWEHVGAGLVQPLDEFAATPEDGDADDFIARLLAAIAGPDVSATRSGRGRCSRSRSTASRTTSPTSPAASTPPASRCRDLGRLLRDGRS